MATLEDVKTNADLQGVLTRELKYSVSFGRQRSIQLSYGRLSASIDETPASGNGLILLDWTWGEPPAAKFGRSNRLGRAGYRVPGPLAHHPKHYRLVLRIKLRFLDGLGRRNSLSAFGGQSGQNSIPITR